MHPDLYRLTILPAAAWGVDGRNDLKLELLRTFALTKSELNATIRSIKFILRAGGGREIDAQMNDAQMVSQEAGDEDESVERKIPAAGP